MVVHAYNLRIEVDQAFKVTPPLNKATSLKKSIIPSIFCWGVLYAHISLNATMMGR